jgi:hypothetical protein
MVLWVYAFRVRKTTSNLQFLGDLVTDDDTSWATDVRATMNQRDRCKGRKDSLGKETDVDLYILLPTLNEIYFTLLYFTLLMP